MANNPSTLPGYNGQTAAPDANYTYGSARDDAAPGDLTGTPRIAAEINDIFGLLQNLLVVAGIAPSGSPDKVGVSQYFDALTKSFDRTFDNMADMVADTTLVLGANVRWIGKTASSDGKGAFGKVVAAATGPADEGYIDLANGLQIQPAFGKFTLGFDSARGRKFFQIYNWVDDLQVVSFADGTNSGDAHVMKLPPDVRRDSHALLCTAGTVGGQNDIDFRTSNFSDYAIINASSAYQAENLTLLFDTKPSRNDGTKKDGTGGGGLTPSEDVYAFDAAMSMPSNRTTDPLTFPALPVQFNQYVELRRRSTGNVYMRFTPNVDDVTITENTSGNTLGKMEDDGITVGGKKLYASNITDLQAANGNHSLSRNLSLGSATPQVYRLAASGQILAGTLRVMTVGSGGASTAGFRHIAFQSDGTTVTTQVIGVDNLEPQFHADLVINAGILDLELLYDGGLGGSGRFSFTVEWDSRSA